ncbi:hypothetical protein BH20ACT5_BH20ACT5_14720 [soil metagenome]
MPFTPEANSLHYTVGPVAAIVAVVLIILFMRWAFSHQSRHDPFAPDAETTGLLEPVARLPRREQALALRAVLSDAGIRSTIREPRGGGAEVLVFPVDTDRARSLAGPFATGAGPH